MSPNTLRGLRDKTYSQTNFISFIVLLIVFVFPRIGLILAISIILSPIKLNKISFLFLQLSFSFGMASLAFSFLRLDESGDVYRYALSFDYLKANLDIYKVYYWTTYEKFYYSWVFLELFVATFLKDFRWLNFISIFILSWCLLSCVKLIIQHNLNSETLRRVLFLKLLCFYSLVIIFTSYKNILAFSLIAYGLLYLYYSKSLKEKCIGWLLITIGVGFHPSGLIIIIL